MLACWALSLSLSCIKCTTSFLVKFRQKSICASEISLVLMLPFLLCSSPYRAYFVLTILLNVCVCMCVCVIMEETHGHLNGPNVGTSHDSVIYALSWHSWSGCSPSLTPSTFIPSDTHDTQTPCLLSSIHSFPVIHSTSTLRRHIPFYQHLPHFTSTCIVMTMVNSHGLKNNGVKAESNRIRERGQTLLTYARADRARMRGQH